MMMRFDLLMILTIVIFVISINADILVYERGNSSVRPFFNESLATLKSVVLHAQMLMSHISFFLFQPMEEFHDLPARFGASFPANGMRALAVKSIPENGCTNITSPNKSEDVNARWVVLIARFVTASIEFETSLIVYIDCVH